MKAKTIKAVIRKKVDDWLESITDSSVRGLAAKNTIVTGGCIASMLLGEKVNDFDLYFRNKETVLAITNYYLIQFYGWDSVMSGPHPYLVNEDDRVKIKIPSKGVDGEMPKLDEDYEPDDPDRKEPDEDENRPKYRPVYLSQNAITLSNKLQLVIRFYGEPEVIHENYDFVHCTNYRDSHSNELVLHKEALESLITKELRYVGSLYPLCSIIRLRKFIKRNWTINAGQILKIYMQLNELDLTDALVLEEQLTGVDILYFEGLLEAIENGDQEKITASYVGKIIDKMF